MHRNLEGGSAHISHSRAGQHTPVGAFQAHGSPRGGRSARDVDRAGTCVDAFRPHKSPRHNVMDTPQLMEK